MWIPQYYFRFSIPFWWRFLIGQKNVSNHKKILYPLCLYYTKNVCAIFNITTATQLYTEYFTIAFRISIVDKKTNCAQRPRSSMCEAHVESSNYCNNAERFPNIHFLWKVLGVSTATPERTLSASRRFLRNSTGQERLLIDPVSLSVRRNIAVNSAKTFYTNLHFTSILLVRNMYYIYVFTFIFDRYFHL